jgi:hypothetical protein
MKAQNQVVSIILIIAIALGALSLVLPWAYGMIQKKKDMKSLDDVYYFFQDLDENIRDVANNGGEKTLTLEVPGMFKVYPESSNSPFNNSITFDFMRKVSNIYLGDWIPLNTPNMNATATLSVDTSSVIFGKATRTGDQILIQYKVWFRELDDLSEKGYKIFLNTTDNQIKTSTTGYMRIQRIGSKEKPVPGKTLTITEINIIV